MRRPNKYTEPHQGQRERQRRLRQAARGWHLLWIRIERVWEILS